MENQAKPACKTCGAVRFIRPDGNCPTCFMSAELEAKLPDNGRPARDDEDSQ